MDDTAANVGKPLIGITCGHTLEGNGRFYLNEPYVRSIEAAGGLPFLIPGLAQEDVERLLAQAHGLLLPGGVDVDPIHFGEEAVEGLGEVNPLWDILDLQAVRTALATDLPVLGICRGAQLLNVAAGGSLYQDLGSQIDRSLCQHWQKAPSWYPIHGVSVRTPSLLAELVGDGPLRVNSFHHQAIKDVAPYFSVVAESSDGIIEAVESHEHRFALGVQWHPEHMASRSPGQAGIFRGFIRAAKEKQIEEV